MPIFQNVQERSNLSYTDLDQKNKHHKNLLTRCLENSQHTVWELQCRRNGETREWLPTSQMQEFCQTHCHGGAISHVTAKIRVFLKSVIKLLQPFVEPRSHPLRMCWCIVSTEGTSAKKLSEAVESECGEDKWQTPF